MTGRIDVAQPVTPGLILRAINALEDIRRGLPGSS